MSKLTSITLISVFLLAPVTCCAADPDQVEVIPLTKPEDIQHASTMDQAIVSISNQVMECVQRKLAPANECFCLYPQELSRLRKTYEVTTKRYPEWKNKTVSYTWEGKSYAISLGGVSRQLQMKCPQNK